MSHVTDKLMRGQYISREECFAEAEDIQRALDCYGPAMAAMEAEELRLVDCICSWDGGHGEDGSGVVRTPKRGCIVHADEDEFDA